MTSYVLFGAGSAGRYALRHLRERGDKVIAFVDNADSKWATMIEGVPVVDPRYAAHNYATAKWVATAISRPAATEIRSQMKSMGIEGVALWECLDVCHGLPPKFVDAPIPYLLGDEKSLEVWADQLEFRANPDYDHQIDPSPISELYFPPFIRHLDDEHFVDCGACDGDTVNAFCSRWESWKQITAIEPDEENFAKLLSAYGSIPNIATVCAAVGDHDGSIPFVSNGDYSSHVSCDSTGVARRTALWKLDTLGRMASWEEMYPPTYIKADVEGSELELLWGAREVIRKHSPVLAVCAYHKSDDLWSIPLLLHALNPDYKLALRRYAEGAFEIVWYAVPPDRIAPRIPAAHESYSDNHEG